MRLIMALALVVLGSTAFAQQAAPPPATRPAMLFKEEWRLPKHDGPGTDENLRFTPEVVTNDRLEAKLYGSASSVVRAAEHEGRIDIWNGLATSPVAFTLRDRRNFVDLTGLARLQWIVRTNSIYTLHPIVKLADGTLIAGNRGISTDGEFITVEIAFGGMKWFKVDPKTVLVTSEVKNPDLSKVDEFGLVALQPAGGHGTAGSFNLSTVELFAKTSPR